MKNHIIYYIIFFISIWSPLQAIEDNIRLGEPIDKLLKEKGELQLKRCGVRIFEDTGIRKIIGLYKINIGDPDKIRQALILNNICGFDGWIFTAKKDKRNYWYKIRVYRAKGTTKSWKTQEVINKNQLPVPYNMMPDKLLGKIEFFNVYPESDHVAVVYIVGMTELSDCETIFDYIYEQKLSLQLPYDFNTIKPFWKHNFKGRSS